MRDLNNIVMGKRPLMEAFRGDITIERVFIQKDADGSSINTIIKKSKQRGITPEFVNKKRLDEMCREGNHQGVCAYISEYKYSELEEILSYAKERNEEPFIVLLDGIEDPQNLGAIIRSVHLLGAHGVVIEKRGSATLTGTVAKTSAGAISHVKVARVTNLKYAIDALKKEGLWFVYADAKGDRMYDINLKGPIGLVVGNEAKGVSRLIRENCDFSASIPMSNVSSGVDSFNASVAMGILGAEIFRQRGL